MPKTVACAALILLVSACAPVRALQVDLSLPVVAANAPMPANERDKAVQLLAAVRQDLACPQPELAIRLIEAGADFRAMPYELGQHPTTSELKSPAFVQAIRACGPDVLRALIARGAPIGWTDLMSRVRAGQPTICSFSRDRPDRFCVAPREKRFDGTPELASELEGFGPSTEFGADPEVSSPAEGRARAYCLAQTQDIALCCAVPRVPGAPQVRAAPAADTLPLLDLLLEDPKFHGDAMQQVLWAIDADLRERRLEAWRDVYRHVISKMSAQARARELTRYDGIAKEKASLLRDTEPALHDEAVDLKLFWLALREKDAAGAERFYEALTTEHQVTFERLMGKRDAWSLSYLISSGYFERIVARMAERNEDCAPRMCEAFLRLGLNRWRVKGDDAVLEAALKIPGVRLDLSALIFGLERQDPAFVERVLAAGVPATADIDVAGMPGRATEGGMYTTLDLVAAREWKDPEAKKRIVRALTAAGAKVTPPEDMARIAQIRVEAEQRYQEEKRRQEEEWRRQDREEARRERRAAEKRRVQREQRDRERKAKEADRRATKRREEQERQRNLARMKGSSSGVQIDAAGALRRALGTGSTPPPPSRSVSPPPSSNKTCSVSQCQRACDRDAPRCDVRRPGAAPPRHIVQDRDASVVVGSHDSFLPRESAERLARTAAKNLAHQACSGLGGSLADVKYWYMKCENNRDGTEAKCRIDATPKCKVKVDNPAYLDHQEAKRAAEREAESCRARARDRASLCKQACSARCR